MTDNESTTEAAGAERPVSRKARELNEEIRYTSWYVFKAVAELP
jgi:hydrogen peroxide-dependent heme synthase